MATSMFDTYYANMINANPYDTALLLEYASELNDRADPKALGYMALTKNKRMPNLRLNNGPQWVFWNERFWEQHGCGVKKRKPVTGVIYEETLPDDWMLACEIKSEHVYLSHNRERVCTFGEEVDNEAFYLIDLVAEAFTKLPPERQQQILQGEL